MLRSLVVLLTTALLAGGSTPRASAALTSAATEPAAPVWASTTDRHADSVYPSVGRPRRRRPRLRPAPALAAADAHAGRRRAAPAGPGAGRSLPARPVRPARRLPARGDRPPDRAAGRVDVPAHRSAPRRLRAGDGRGVDVRRGGLVPRAPGAHAGAVEPRRHGRARLADHAGRPGLDDAGAVRRVHVVPGQRPPVRQGDLPRRARRAAALGRGLQRPARQPPRRARPHADALHQPRPDGVLPDDGRDRALRALHADRAARAAADLLGAPRAARSTSSRCARPRPRCAGWRAGSGPTRSTGPASW